MSLDKTLRPDRPGLDELVPSRYALKVGAMADVMGMTRGRRDGGSSSMVQKRASVAFTPALRSDGVVP